MRQNTNFDYRAIAHQVKSQASDRSAFAIESLGRTTDSAALTFEYLRLEAANYMRQHRDDFEPFINADDGASLSFEDYCSKVSCPLEAVWGGQLELRALSAVLDRPIWVYDALQPTIKMGDSENEPLRVAFHRHFFSLGEHYNSVIAKS